MTETLMPYDDVLAAFDPALGLEVHVELNTASKMFCGCPAVFGGEPNSGTCPTCLGLPGAMPVVNGKAVESAIRIGLALNCDIAEWCRFARKNYFYPDMPKNFQTSQYDEPIAFDGWMDVEVDGETFRVEIERAHMEEDTGKSLHVGGSTGRIHGADYSLVDYNRAGIPLIEIVTRPIMGAGERAPEVARAYVAQLRELILALGVSEARMDQGNLRADVNLSLAPKGTGALGTRTETKNVNSFRSVERAVRFEMQRHAAILSGGGSILQETRHWHEDTGVTTSGRVKSDADDYRYFPEPDLVPVAPSREWVEELRGTLPENPTQKRARLQAEWGFSDLEMRDTIGAGAFGLVEETIAAGATPRRPASGGSPSSPAAPTTPGPTSPPSGSPRPTSPPSRSSSTRAASTTSSPARSSRACTPARARRRRSSRPVAWPSCPTTGRWGRPSTRRSPTTPTSPTRSATARSRRPARSSDR